MMLTSVVQVPASMEDASLARAPVSSSTAGRRASPLVPRDTLAVTVRSKDIRASSSLPTDARKTPTVVILTLLGAMAPAKSPLDTVARSLLDTVVKSPQAMAVRNHLAMVLARNLLAMGLVSKSPTEAIRTDGKKSVLIMVPATCRAGSKKRPLAMAAAAMTRMSTVRAGISMALEEDMEETRAMAAGIRP
jgi:hypothetical protein